MKLFSERNGRLATFSTLILALLATSTCYASSHLHNHINRHHIPHTLQSPKRQHQNNHDGTPDASQSDHPQCPYPRARPRNGSRATASPLLTDSRIYDKYKASSSYYRANSYPHLTDSSGAWVWVGADWWTSGFYPATLYLLGERASMCPGSSDVDWVKLGRQWSQGIVPLESGNSVGHDVGFLSLPFMHELNINPNDSTALDGMKKFAKMLADRYDGTVGCTRSWDSSWPDFLVIMDNMMNLELLCDAAELFNKDNYWDIATSHAEHTAKNHVRPDSSSYHVVNYNQQTGEVTRRYTAQGYADWSTWSRGQAWGVYGFTMMYQKTGHQPFLDVGRAMASRWLLRLAEDPTGVPKWDFDAPEPTSRDTSAAAIVSVGLLELYKAETALGNSTGAAFWRDNAITVLSTTANKYFEKSSSWNAILSHGTSNHPNGVYDTGLVYGDYYFVKAGNMLLDLGLIACP